MRKYISLFLALLLAVSLAACKDKDNPTIEGKEQNQGGISSESKTAQFAGKKAEPVMKLIASGKYMYEIKNVENNNPITFATTGDKSLLTYTDDDSQLTFMHMGGKYYLVLQSNKSYCELTPNVANKYKVDLNSIKALFKSASMKEYLNYTPKGDSEGEADVQGRHCSYEDYYNPMTQKTRRLYFDDDNNLVFMAGIEKNGQESALAEVFISAATNTVFDQINEYSLVDMEKETAVRPAN